MFHRIFNSCRLIPAVAPFAVTGLVSVTGLVAGTGLAQPFINDASATERPMVNRQVESPLRWKFAVNQIYTFDFKQTTNITTMVAENPKTKNRSTEQRMIVQWKVLSVDEQSADVEMTYKRVDFEIENDGRATASTDDNVPTVGAGPILRLAKDMVKSIKPLLDQPMILKVTPQGKIVSLQIEKEVVDAILTAPNSMSLRSNLTKEGVESIMGSFLVPLPENDTETWERSTTVDFNGIPLTSNTTYRLNPLVSAADQVEIGFKTEVSFPEEKTLPPANPSEQKNTELQKYPAPYNFDPVSEKLPRIKRQESSGTIQFDTEQGFATGSKGLMVLVTEKSQSNFIIRTTIETKTDVTVTQTLAN